MVITDMMPVATTSAIEITCMRNCYNSLTTLR